MIIFCKELGYCQGLSEIAALLLLYLEEELVFWTLVKLFEDDKIRSIYTPAMEGLHVVLAVFESLTKKFIPEIFEHLVCHSISKQHIVSVRLFYNILTSTENSQCECENFCHSMVCHFVSCQLAMAHSPAVL
jgi:hypothetical protein